MVEGAVLCQAACQQDPCVVEGAVRSQGAAGPELGVRSLRRRHRAVRVASALHGDLVVGGEECALAAVRRVPCILVLRDRLVCQGRGSDAHTAGWRHSRLTCGRLEACDHRPVLITWCRALRKAIARLLPSGGLGSGDACASWQDDWQDVEVAAAATGAETRTSHSPPGELRRSSRAVIRWALANGGERRPAHLGGAQVNRRGGSRPRPRRPREVLATSRGQVSIQVQRQDEVATRSPTLVTGGSAIHGRAHQRMAQLEGAVLTADQPRDLGRSSKMRRRSPGSR
jgi:hypothetical protein